MEQPEILPTMTKNFCDLCGEPAHDDSVSAFINVESAAWSGYKADGMGGCDGRWVPVFKIVPRFLAENLKDRPREHNPDLCRACKAKLVKLLLDTLST